MAHPIGLALGRHPVELVDRQDHKRLDLLSVRIPECLRAFGLGALDGSRVGHTSMGGDWVARPDRADFAGSLITDYEDEIHDWRAGFGELVPRLGHRAGQQ